ncbi:chorismate mutase [Mycobacterium sp. WMMD1722]|uniref:chorismate mutase n=1 Tax=Mycobacterium sp. WMMD1722 TaxID=3404117 RepID=UPI003BF5BE5C
MGIVAGGAALTGAAPAAADPGPLQPLVDAAAERLAVAEPVAANKWVTKGSIEDPVRVDQVLAAVEADANARSIDGQRVRRVFADQIAATEGIEYTRFGQWKLDPAAAPVAAPELAASRGVIDGLNRTIVEQLASNWPVLNSPECPASVADAIGAVSTARSLDPLYRQALTFVTRNYCTP